MIIAIAAILGYTIIAGIAYGIGIEMYIRENPNRCIKTELENSDNEVMIGIACIVWPLTLLSILLISPAHFAAEISRKIFRNMKNRKTK